jgi:S-adenosylmethionine hydrolase
LPEPPLITFLSDYGHADEFAGVCHGVIAHGCPQAHVIDITHAIPRQDVLTGALVLRDAVSQMPPAVHLAIVDPGVGGERRAVALAAATPGHLLVGPDNGLLWLAAERLGGVREAVDIGRSPFRREPVSATFHGRDIFAPVAAALAAGAGLQAAGDSVAPAEVVRLELPSAYLREDGLAAHVLRSDTFGNLVLDATTHQLAEAGIAPGAELRVELGGKSHGARRAGTFAHVAPGELLLYEDATGMIALAVNLGSAAERLHAASGEELLLRGATR